jgi:hypothetical protein
MKKDILIIITLLFTLNLFCELDYQLESEFAFGGIANLKYSNGKIMSRNAYGYTIYEIQDSGNLETISNVRFSPQANHYYSYDKLGAYSGYFTFGRQEDLGSYFTIYDTSIPNQQTVLYHTQINIENMFSAELFENYFIRKTGNHSYTVFDYNTFQPVSYVDNISLLYDTKVNDDGAVLQDYSDNCYYYYVIDDTGNLHRKYNLGSEERKVAISGDKLITYSMGDIKLYNITGSDSLEYTGSTFYNNNPLLSVVFADNKVIFTSEEGFNPKVLMLEMYEIDDENNFNLIDSEQIYNNPSSNLMPGSSLVIVNNTLYISVIDKKFIQAQIANNSMELLDVNYIGKGMSSPYGFVKNNIFYTMCFEEFTSLDSYSLENYSNVQEIDNYFPGQSAYWYFPENEKIVRFDEEGACFYFYDWINDDLILTDSYNLQGFVDNTFLSTYKWDGNQFIYRIDSSLISVKKENGNFVETWILDDGLLCNYEVYQNYIYQLKSNQGIKVYSFDESEYQLVNTFTLPFVSNFPAIFIKGNILTTNRKNIVDLSVDPEGLSMRYDLNQFIINSSALKYYDYLMYCGKELIETSEGENVLNNVLSIYKLINDVPIRVGAIESDYRIQDFQILDNGSEESFDILLSHNNFFSIYSCQATPNGNLDITPVILNSSNYPNPFNPETTISYHIPKKGNVTVDIYNIKGQKVKSLLKEEQEAGKHSIIWKGNNDQGQKVSSGTYLYRVKSGDEEIVNKMMLVK